MNEKYTYQGHRKEVAEEFIKLIKEGTAPWQQPWDEEKILKYNISLLPSNAISGMPYRGMNSIQLLYSGLTKSQKANKLYDPRWCTFKQANDHKWRIKKGAKSVPIEFWITKELREIEDEKTGEKKKVWIDLPKNEIKFRVYRVFNACDIEGIPPLEDVHDKKLEINWKPIDEAEKLLANSGAKIFYDDIKAYYRPSDDTVHLPNKVAFEKQEDFYHTAFHELTHWTGAKQRLNRLSNAKFGTIPYAKEELVADIGGFLTCIKLNMPYKPLQNKTASYLDSWLKALDDNPNELFKAANQADVASQYLFNLAKEKEKNIDNTQNGAEEKKETVIVSRSEEKTVTEGKNTPENINTTPSVQQKKSIEELEQKYHFIEKFSVNPNSKKQNILSKKRIENILSTNFRKNVRTTAKLYLLYAKEYLNQNNNVWNNNFDKKIINDLAQKNKNAFDIQVTLAKYSPACYSKKDLISLNKTIREQVESNSYTR